MATVLDVIKGLNQAASNAYDGYENMDNKIGLKREDGNPIVDSRIIDGFKVRFAGNNMIVTYQSEVMLKDLHPRNQFENEIERTFADIIKFMKKEYKKVTKESVTLSPVGETNMMVQTTSRIRNWVQAVKQYKIGADDGTVSIKEPSSDTVDKSVQKFLDLVSNKKMNKAPKNPDTPEG
jgi:hypothetical protein